MGNIKRFARLLVTPFLYPIIQMPGKSYEGPLPALTADQRLSLDYLKEIVTKLSVEIGERNTHFPESLVASQEFVAAKFIEHGWTVTTQAFTEFGVPMSNIIAEIKGDKHPDQIVVVGAHFDSVFGAPGADDNASAVAALLEMARQLSGVKFDRTLRLVAFGNEECQDRTPEELKNHQMGSNMGSKHYAQSCRERGDNIIGMWSLEMLAFYSDEPGSQTYPLKQFNWIFPTVGNYIGFVGDLKSRPWICRSIKLFRECTQFPSEGVAAPSFLKDANRSDHEWFILYGYPGLMITDMANFRNPHYHKPSDTIETLNFERFTLVTSGLIEVVRQLVA